MIIKRAFYINIYLSHIFLPTNTNEGVLDKKCSSESPEKRLCTDAKLYFACDLQNRY